MKNKKNGTVAALAAGYSEHSAGNTAYLLLRKEEIQNEISRLEKIEEEKAGVSEERTLLEAAIIAHSDITDFLEVKEIEEEIDGEIKTVGIAVQIKPSSEWPKEKRRAVQSIKQTKQGIELKLHGKDFQLTNLFKHFKLFSEGAEETPASNLKDILQGRIKEIWKDHEDKN